MTEVYFIDEIQRDLPDLDIEALRIDYRTVPWPPQTWKPMHVVQEEATQEIYADMEAEERRAIIDEEEGPGPGE